jgi:hypothetical protein
MSETDAGSFDATSYRQRVLASLRSAAQLDLSDPFFIVDLPVDVDDEALIRARITALVGFWNKERSPNYKSLAGDLARHRADLEAVLLDPVARAACAGKVKAARAAADADRYGALDSLASQLVERYQGIPRSRMPSLARLARTRGIDDAAFAIWASGYRVIEDGADAEPLPAAIRAQIRSDLDEFGRLAGEQDRSATLWSFLGLAPTAPDSEVDARRAELAAQNERRQHDHQMTVVANLLTYVAQHLTAADRARYAASLAEDAKDRVRDYVAEKIIVDGELNAADFEACVLRVMRFGFGLSGEQARAAVRQVATDLGATLAVAPAVDYVVCPGCREPQPPPESGACRYCGADLFMTCPACSRRVEAAALACPSCGASFRLIRAVQEQAAAARAELGGGRPVAARAALAGAERSARGAAALTADIASLSAEIERIISAANADWQAAGADLAGNRLYAAIDRLTRIARIAADVTGPDGTAAAARLDDLSGRKAAIQAEIGAVRRLPDSEQEAALGRILSAAADCPEALAMLAALPLAGPARLRSVVTSEAVMLSWDAAPAQGAVSYKITRLTSAPDGSRPETRSLGSTATTSFEDAGVPGGVLVSHQVTATSGRRASVPAHTEPAFMARDITGLAARAGESGVTISWSLPISSGNVVIERTADPQAGLRLPPRRALAEPRAQSWQDVGPTPGVEFTYQVHAEYRDAAGGLVRTVGASVRATAGLTPHG